MFDSQIGKHGIFVLSIKKYTISLLGMVGTVADRLTAALLDVGSILARNKYLDDLQVVVPDLCVFVYEIQCSNVGQVYKKQTYLFPLHSNRQHGT